MNNYKIIKFIGKDYSKIDDTEIDVSCTDTSIYSYVEANKRKILDDFLVDVTNDYPNLIINSRNDQKYDFYDPKFNEGIYGGIVGVINKDITYIDEEDNNKPHKFNITLEILTRFDKDIKKPYFLSTLLFGDKIKLNDKVFSTNVWEDLFKYLFVYWFNEDFEKAYLKGFYKTYNSFEENGYRIKGNIDFARYIKSNIFYDNGRITYTYRENNIDNYFNHMLVATYESLKRMYPKLVIESIDNDYEIGEPLNQLKLDINYGKYDIRTIIFKNLQAISHPYFYEYEKLRKTCLLILRNEGVDIFNVDVDNNEVKGVLFYIPDLWELYLENIMDRHALKYVAQHSIKVFGNVEGGFIGSYNTRPDYLFGENNNYYMILDAKFKPGWRNALNGNLNSYLADDYDKCIRDMNTINAHKTGTIFPILFDKNVDKTKYIEEHRVSKYNEDVFYTIPVKIPKSEDYSYSEWKKELNANIEDFMNDLKSKVN